MIPPDRQEYGVVIYYMTAFLILLQLLHIYWFALLSKVGFRLISEGSGRVRIGVERPVQEEELKED